ncbi:nuclear body associated kinase [Culex quinquefasciatus]|uniref:Nuclear body associated kinase n=1 Tax=Culex quinquefasciatus TaxID=7176 RepID=B0WF04_CULQU|nr:nuclear body associated kinase [Culex quinquefasciatus]|eukprot:XP_001847288.1 nuclear body associated kinase [Culex quinquefasciatus]
MQPPQQDFNVPVPASMVELSSSQLMLLTNAIQLNAAWLRAGVGRNRPRRVRISQADKRFSWAPSGSSLHHYSGQRESAAVHMTSSSSSSSAAAA